MVSRDVLIVTVFFGFSMAFLGIQMSQRGPAFIDLLHISGTDVEGGSMYITGQNVTYMLGSIISGYLYSRIKMTSLTLAVTIILTGLLSGATPWCTHFVSMLLVISAGSLFIGIFDTTINTEQMRICKGNSGWAMQFLSFCFSVGGIIGPLITEPFLSPKDAANSTEDDVTFNRTQKPPSVYSSPTSSDTTVSSVHYTSTSMQWPTTDGEMSTGSDPGSTKHMIRYAFLITSILGFMTSIPFLVQFFRSNSKEDKTEKRSESTPSSRKLSAKPYLTVVITASIYYFLFAALDDAFIQYLSYFVVNHLDWSKQDSALLMALYWVFSTFTKLALILLASRINTGIILMISNIGTAISCLGFTIASQLYVHSLVWVFTALIALSSSAIFGGGMAWVDSNLHQMDGKATACVFVSAGLGSTVVPIPIGVLMKNWNTMAFAYIMLGLSCLDTFVVTVLLFIIKPFIQMKYGPPRPVTERETSPQVENPDTANEVMQSCISFHLNNNDVACIPHVPA